MRAAILAALLCCGCSALGAAATKAAVPVAVEAAKKLVESVSDYVRAKGKTPEQVNCEEEWHPKERTLLILCDVVYSQDAPPAPTAPDPVVLSGD